MDGSASRPRRVWVVSEVYYPDDNATGHYLTGIAEALAAEFPVQVLCTQPSYAARGRKAARREWRHGVSIRRCWGTTFDKDVLPLRCVNLLTVTASIFLQALLRFRRGDRVLVVNVPPLAPLAVVLAGRLRGAQCVLLVHDVYPDALAVAGLVRRASWVYRALDRLFGRLYRSCRRLVVIGRDMARLVGTKLPPGDDRVTIIPNWAELDWIRPAAESAAGEETTIRTELGLDGKFVVQYSGNMGRTHNVEILIEAARRFRENDRIHFLLAGTGARREWVIETVRAENLRNVTVAERRPRHELPDFLRTADVAVISFMPRMAGVSVPSRLYNVLAAGRPVIAVADPDSELALTLTEEAAGWVVAPDDVAAFCRAIRQAADDPQRLRRAGLQARRAAERRFSYEHVAAAYCELMRSLGTDRQSRSMWDENENASPTPAESSESEPNARHRAA